jgi:hypothetical protein
MNAPSGLRYSLRRLLGLVALLCVLFGMSQNSNAFSGVFLMAVWLLLGVAVLAIVFLHGEACVFWFGFVLFGGTYFWVLNRSELADLPMHHGIVAISTMLDRHDVPTVAGSVVWKSRVYSPFEFHLHLICCAATGIVGGFIARSLYRRNPVRLSLEWIQTVPPPKNEGPQSTESDAIRKRPLP